MFERDAVVFQVTDFVANLVGREMFDIDLGVGDRLLQHLFAVLHVVDRVVLLQADQRCVLAEESGAEAVKRSGPRKVVRRKRLQPIPHLVGGFVGERQRNDLPGRNALSDHMRDAMRDDSGFATAGAGQDQQRTVGVLDGVSLRVVETFNEFLLSFDCHDVWSFNDKELSRSVLAIDWENSVKIESSTLGELALWYKYSCLNQGRRTEPVSIHDRHRSRCNFAPDSSVLKLIYREGPQMARTRIPLSAVEEEARDLREKLELSTAEIGLTVRTTNCLEEKGIFTVKDLLNTTRAELLSISNFGEKTLEEVYKSLASIGFQRKTRDVKPR